MIQLDNEDCKQSELSIILDLSYLDDLLKRFDNLNCKIQIYFIKAKIQDLRGKYLEAKDCFEQARQLIQQNKLESLYPDFHYSMGYYYFINQNKDEAKSNWSKYFMIGNNQERSNKFFNLSALFMNNLQFLMSNKMLIQILKSSDQIQMIDFDFYYDVMLFNIVCNFRQGFLKKSLSLAEELLKSCETHIQLQDFIYLNIKYPKFRIIMLQTIIYKLQAYLGNFQESLNYVSLSYKSIQNLKQKILSSNFFKFITNKKDYMNINECEGIQKAYESVNLRTLRQSKQLKLSQSIQKKSTKNSNENLRNSQSLQQKIIDDSTTQHIRLIDLSVVTLSQEINEIRIQFMMGNISQSLELQFEFDQNLYKKNQQLPYDYLSNIQIFLKLLMAETFLRLSQLKKAGQILDIVQVQLKQQRQCEKQFRYLQQLYNYQSGIYLYESFQPELAIQILRNNVKDESYQNMVDQRYIESLYYLGIIYLDLNQKQEAIKCLDILKITSQIVQDDFPIIGQLEMQLQAYLSFKQNNLPKSFFQYLQLDILNKQDQVLDQIRFSQVIAARCQFSTAINILNNLEKKLTQKQTLQHYNETNHHLIQLYYNLGSTYSSLNDHIPVFIEKLHNLEKDGRMNQKLSQLIIFRLINLDFTILNLFEKNHDNKNNIQLSFDLNQIVIQHPPNQQFLESNIQDINRKIKLYYQLSQEILQNQVDHSTSFNQNLEKLIQEQENILMYSKNKSKFKIYNS